MSGADTRAQEIAGKLTKAQREAIRDAKEAVWGLDNYLIPCVHSQTYRCLERDGLVGTEASSRSLTPLGLAVRRILERGIIYLTPDFVSGSYLLIGGDGAAKARRYDMAYIAIEWNYGRPNTGADQDEARASAAAEKVLDDAGVDYAEAEAEYQRQWLEFDDEAPMTGLALVWIKARQAADIALTEGWHNTDGASCSIMAG